MKKKRKILIALAAVLVIALAAGFYFMGKPKEVTSYPEFETAQEKPVSEEQSEGTARGIEIPGYKSITVEAGTKDVTVDLTNPEGNEVYFEISFYLPDTDETIYTSKLIKPGQHIYNITLERELEAGEYPLTVKYATYSADDNLDPRNGADVNCTLIAV